MNSSERFHKLGFKLLLNFATEQRRPVDIYCIAKVKMGQVVKPLRPLKMLVEKGFVFTKSIPKKTTCVTLSSPAAVQRRRLLRAGVGVLGGQLYAAGGHDGPLVRKSVEVYDAQTNAWRLVCDMNMCRRNAGQTGRRGLRSRSEASSSEAVALTAVLLPQACAPSTGCCT